MALKPVRKPLRAFKCGTAKKAQVAISELFLASSPDTPSPKPAKPVRLNGIRMLQLALTEALTERDASQKEVEQLKAELECVYASKLRLHKEVSSLCQRALNAEHSMSDHHDRERRLRLSLGGFLVDRSGLDTIGI